MALLRSVSVNLAELWRVQSGRGQVDGIFGGVNVRKWEGGNVKMKKS